LELAKRRGRGGKSGEEEEGKSESDGISIIVLCGGGYGEIEG